MTTSSTSSGAAATRASARSAAARSSSSPPASRSGRRLEQQVRVRHRRQLAAAPVARRPRLGARTLRADAERAAGVAPDDRAAAGADRVHVERRQPDRKAADEPLARARRLAADDRADVRRGAAHVERERVLDPGEPRDARRPDDARRRPREQRPGGVPGRLLERGDTARRAHDQRHGQPRLLAARGERPQIAPEQRTEVRVRGRRRRPLVLPKLRRRLVRGDDVCLRMPAAQLRHDRALVRRVAEGEEEADRDRLRVAQVGQRREVERRQLAFRPDPPAHAERALERHERLRMRGAEPVEVRAVLAPQVEHVLEALGRDERRPRAAPLEQRVRRDRRPVREPLERRRPRPPPPRPAPTPPAAAPSAPSPSAARRRRAAPRR